MTIEIPTEGLMIGNTHSPGNANLFLPVGDGEQQRREAAETEATQQMDVLTQAVPATDGGTSN